MKQRGFTLIEVLVALAVLALVAAAAGRQAMQMLQELERLEQQTQALWLAEEELRRLQRHQPWPTPGRYQRPLEALGQRWQVLTEVHPTASADLRRIVIGVGPADQPEPVFQLTAYGGRH